MYLGARRILMENLKKITILVRLNGLISSLSLCYSAVIVNMDVSLIRNTGYASATEVLKFG